MTNSVPDRWLDYKAFGNVIKGTKILAFKVPLKDGVAKNLEPEQRFTTAILLQEFPHLKYIVDLTNTYRYYDKKEFTNAGVKYEKIAIPGRKVPTMDIIKKFFKVMDDFTSICGEGELIGVHCTHGVNRTGYLICRYLIQQLGWETQDSLNAFGEARGYPVERDIYLTALNEVQRGKKIDTSKVVLTPNPIDIGYSSRKNPFKTRSSLKNLSGRSGAMGPPSFTMSRRGFANGRPFSSQRFGIAGPPPAYGPMPPGMPPIPPMSPPLYGHRPFRYGPPPMRPAMLPPTPPGPGFLHPGFPPRRPCPPRMAGPPRLPAGPNVRLPLPKMPPPPPPPPPSRKQLQVQKKKQQMRNGIMERTVNIRPRRNGPVNSRIMTKAHKEQDFTVDTFEENLLTTSTVAQPRRQTRGRFNQNK